MEGLHNPENIQTFLHKTQGKIVLADNQGFQAIYNSDNSIKRLELWEKRNDLFYRVANFLGKSVLILNV